MLDFLSAELWPTQRPQVIFIIYKIASQQDWRSQTRLVEVWQSNNAELEQKDAISICQIVQKL